MTQILRLLASTSKFLRMILKNGYKKELPRSVGNKLHSTTSIKVSHCIKVWTWDKRKILTTLLRQSNNPLECKTKWWPNSSKWILKCRCKPTWWTSSRCKITWWTKTRWLSRWTLKCNRWIKWTWCKTKVWTQTWIWTKWEINKWWILTCSRWTWCRISSYRCKINSSSSNPRCCPLINNKLLRWPIKTKLWSLSEIVKLGIRKSKLEENLLLSWLREIASKEFLLPTNSMKLWPQAEHQ